MASEIPTNSVLMKFAIDGVGLAVGGSAYERNRFAESIGEILVSEYDAGAFKLGRMSNRPEIASGLMSFASRLSAI